MYSIRHCSLILCLMLLSFQARAQNIPLQNLNQNDLQKITGDVSASFLHTSVSGASPLGHIFGFELGVIGGQASTPQLQTIAQQNTGANASKLPFGQLLGVITVPLGFTGEIGLVPKIGNSDFKFNNFSIAAKWTPTEVFGDLPFSLAGKVSYTKTSLDFNQSVSGSQESYSMDDSTTALTVLVSKNLAIIEPYVGVGYVTATGNLSGSGSATVFNQSYTQSNSASATTSGVQWMVGTEVKLLVVKLGAEYSNMFGASRIAGKLSFYF
jgi:hypothetical protein